LISPVELSDHDDALSVVYSGWYDTSTSVAREGSRVGNDVVVVIGLDHDQRLRDVVVVPAP
jgi:hypothetical protein